jgi:hypothetical protein
VEGWYNTRAESEQDNNQWSNQLPLSS